MAAGVKYQNVYCGGNVSRMDWWAFSPEGATRLYDPATGRFTRPDPLSPDYATVSHYSFCLNNPLILTDPTGSDIVVLLKENGLHMGLLITNEEGKYQYYSINGDNMGNISGNVDSPYKGGKHYDEIGVGNWDNAQDFLDSDFNREAPDENPDNPDYDKYEYTLGLEIETTSEQDNIARDTFTSISQNEEYDFLFNNCAQGAQRAIKATGIKINVAEPYSRIPLINAIMDRKIKLIKSQTPVPYPEDAYRNIKKANPQAKEIKKNKP